MASPAGLLLCMGLRRGCTEQRAPGTGTSRAVWGSWLCRCGCPSLTRDKINSGWMLEEAEPRRAEQWRKAVFQEPGERTQPGTGRGNPSFFSVPPGPSVDKASYLLGWQMRNISKAHHHYHRAGKRGKFGLRGNLSRTGTGSKHSCTLPPKKTLYLPRPFTI